MLWVLSFTILYSKRCGRENGDWCTECSSWVAILCPVFYSKTCKLFTKKRAFSALLVTDRGTTGQRGNMPSHFFVWGHAVFFCISLLCINTFLLLIFRFTCMKSSKKYAGKMRNVINYAKFLPNYQFSFRGVAFWPPWARLRRFYPSPPFRHLPCCALYVQTPSARSYVTSWNVSLLHFIPDAFNVLECIWPLSCMNYCFITVSPCFLIVLRVFCICMEHAVSLVCWTVVLLGIPVYSEHAIAAYFAYFAKMRISHVFRM